MNRARDLNPEYIRAGGFRWLTGLILPLCAFGLLAGCATLPPPQPLPERISAPPENQKAAPILATQREEEMTGDLVRFDQIRTVLVTDESIQLPDGRKIRADEIRPILENELIARNFRIFSGTIPPETPVEQLTRNVHGHLLVQVKANSEFVNTTGKFSKYRARAEATAVRGRDGTKLAMATAEATGPRKQDQERAGEMALRQIAQDLTNQLVEDLMTKTDQLLWSALVVRGVDTSAKAKQIEVQLEAQEGLGYVELLGWDETSRTATYEIMHGLKHDSDLLTALNRIPGVRVQVATYQPDSMETLRRTMINFK